VNDAGVVHIGIGIVIVAVSCSSIRGIEWQAMKRSVVTGASFTRSLIKIRMSGIDAATLASASSAGDWAEVLFEEVRASHFATISRVSN
jgi:hypothetical protein